MFQALRVPGLFVATVLISITGCGQPGPARAPIRGRITVGGQPLAGGRILFMPLAPTSGPAASARIVNGEYQLSKTDGPLVGQNRVEVEADLDLGFALDDEAAFAKRGKPLPKNRVPPAFNLESTLVTHIQADEQNNFDAAIPAAR